MHMVMGLPQAMASRQTYLSMIYANITCDSRMLSSHQAT